MSGPALARIGGPPPARGADRHDGKVSPRTIISPNRRCSAELAARVFLAAGLPDTRSGEPMRAGGETKPAVAFVDVSGFVRLADAAGDAAAAECAARLEGLAQEAGGAHGGRLVKSLGDGVMLAFADPAAAVACSLRLVAGSGRDGLPPARAGVACGPLVGRDGDLFGRTVNLASRLAAYARAHEVLAASEVVAALDGAAAAAFWPIGPVLLKGLAEPVAVYAVQAAALDEGYVTPGGRRGRQRTSRAPTGALEDEDAT